MAHVNVKVTNPKFYFNKFPIIFLILKLTEKIARVTLYSWEDGNHFMEECLEGLALYLLKNNCDAMLAFMLAAKWKIK